MDNEEVKLEEENKPVEEPKAEEPETPAEEKKEEKKPNSKAPVEDIVEITKLTAEDRPLGEEVEEKRKELF